MNRTEEAHQALAAWDMADAELIQIAIGLINVTFEVRTGADRFILQRVNPIFSPLVHDDIAAVTAHLAAKNMTTPHLVETKDKRRWTTIDDGVWRVLTYVEGETHERAPTPGHAEEAGALLGRFHRAVADLDHEFANRRLGVHDTPKHMAVLEDAVNAHTEHRLYAEVASLARDILGGYSSLAPIAKSEDRIVHGDPKISNVIFDALGRARCLVDLDTLARMPIHLELGDAFRSWCNPAGEDGSSASFSLDLFESAVRGYATGSDGLLTDGEIAAIVPATETILLELAARFAADALAESYFGFDAKRFATLGDHNLLRATRQLQVARSLDAVRSDAEAVVHSAFAS